MANLVESPANITDKRSARKAENRIAIVEAAESLILEGGYGALNAEALAEADGEALADGVVAPDGDA